jgi:hypothetical protein
MTVFLVYKQTIRVKINFKILFRKFTLCCRELYPTTNRNMLEELNLQKHHCVDVKYRKF